MLKDDEHRWWKRALPQCCNTLGSSVSEQRIRFGTRSLKEQKGEWWKSICCEEQVWDTLLRESLRSGMATPANVSASLLPSCIHLGRHCLPWKGNPACSIITTLLPWNSEVSDFAACETKGSFAVSQNKFTVVTFLLHQRAWHFRRWLRPPFVGGRERGSLWFSVIGSFYLHNSFCYLIHMT